MNKIIQNKKFVFISLFLTILLGASVRLYQIDKDPVSLFGDELDVGYQALSILQTGRDYSGNFLPMHMQSLTEWRTPLYIYASIPTVAIFGISPLGVRLPAAIFGILGILITYFLVKELTKNKYIGFISAVLLAILPWHILYSRAGFEVTMLYTFFFGGILLFLRGLKNNLWLIPSAILLGFTPWIYSTAKLFLPMTVLILFFIWFKEISKIKRKYLFISLAIFLLITIPFAINTIFGGGAVRFDSISIFNRPTLSGEIGEVRLRDSQMGGIFSAPIIEKVMQNKIVFFGNIFINNYFKSLSPEFLFTQGDPSPRQNSSASGGFYVVEALFIVFGLYFIFARKKEFENNERLTILFLLLAGPIPGDLTQGGGNHATRQFLLIFPLIFLGAVGIFYITKILKGRIKLVWIGGAVVVLLWSFISYIHYFFSIYPWDSERWWQAGFQGAITSAVAESKYYNRVIISSAGEPALKYFLAWSKYPPAEFQKEGTKDIVQMAPFGPMVKEGKFLFPDIGKFVDVYGLGKVLPPNTLYLATTQEVVYDLGKNPDRIPKDIKVVKIIRYPSGEPAFYLLTKR